MRYAAGYVVDKVGSYYLGDLFNTATNYVIDKGAGILQSQFDPTLSYNDAHSLSSAGVFGTTFLVGSAGQVLDVAHYVGNVRGGGSLIGGNHANYPSNYWNKTEFNDRNVYQRNDLINPNLVDPKTGLTNLELMEKGRAPLTINQTTGKYEPIQLHHMTQAEVNGYNGTNGALAEVTTQFHQQNTKTIHVNVKDSNYPEMNPGINESSFRNDPVQNSAFNQYRTDYWKNRANDFK